MTAIHQRWGEWGSCYPSQGHGGQETSHGSFAFAEDPAAPACCDVCGAGLVVVAAPASAVVPAGSGDDGPGAPGVVGGAPGDGGTVVAGNDVAVVDGPGAGVAVVVGDLEVDAAAVVGVDAAGPGDGAGDGAVLVGGGGGDGAAVVGGGPGDGAVVVGGGPGDGDGAAVVVGPGDGAPVVDVVAVVAAVVGGAVVVDGAVVVGDGAVVVVGDGAVVVAAVVAAVVGGAVVVGDGAVVEPGPGGDGPRLGPGDGPGDGGWPRARASSSPNTTRTVRCNSVMAGWHGRIRKNVLVQLVRMPPCSASFDILLQLSFKLAMAPGDRWLRLNRSNSEMLGSSRLTHGGFPVR